MELEGNGGVKERGIRDIGRGERTGKLNLNFWALLGATRSGRELLTWLWT